MLILNIGMYLIDFNCVNSFHVSECSAYEYIRKTKTKWAARKKEQQNKV